MDERGYDCGRGLDNTSSSYRLPEGVRPICWEEEDRLLFRAQERARRERDLKLRKDSFEFSESGLINCIIGLIDLGREDYAVIIERNDGSFFVNPNLTLSFEGCKKSIVPYVLPFVKSKKQLIAISRFVGKTLNSATASILQDFAIHFLSEHAESIKSYYVEQTLGLHTLILSLCELIRPLTIAYNLLSSVMMEDYWDFRLVERFLERFLHVMAFAELQSEKVQKVVRDLQFCFFSLLERYFNFIFKNGFVESVYTEEFLFYNINEDGAIKLGLRDPVCSLWSRELINNVLNGARDACRLQLGRKDYKLNAFSKYFRDDESKDESSFMTCRKFQEKVYSAAQLCAIDNARMLFFYMNENNKLGTLLDEIEQVYTGFALRDLAYDLFGADRTTSDCDVTVSFQNSLRSSGFQCESCERWTVLCTSGLLETLTIRPKLEWPLIYVINEVLIDTFNKCLRFLLHLIRGSEVLSKIRIEYTEVDKIGLNKRRFNLLLCVISQPLNIMAELFFMHLSSLISKNLPLIRNAKTIEEASIQVMSLNKLLNNLVMKEGARKLVHEAIAKLWSMGDEIYERLRTNCMKPADLENMLKVAIREKQLLVGIGKGMEGTFFMALQLFLP